MRKQKQTIDLTFHNGQYRLSCGSEIKGEDGPVHDPQKIAELTNEQYSAGRKPRVWMLGKDSRIATLKAAVIRQWWKKCKAATTTPTRKAVWLADFFKKVEGTMQLALETVEDAQQVTTTFD